MKKYNIKKNLMVFLTVLLVSIVAVGSILVLSSHECDESNYQSLIPPQVLENNTKLLEVSERLERELQ